MCIVISDQIISAMAETRWQVRFTFDELPTPVLAAAGVTVHGELVNATEHDAANVIIQRAKELKVDIIVLGYQHYRGSSVAEHVIRQHPHCSVLLARPPR